MRRATLQEFIIKANLIHNNKFDYSKVNYQNNYTKICIICPEHGEFWATPLNHCQNHDCPKCSSISTSEFIKRATAKHGSLYNYSKVICVNARTKICIICPRHGEFFQLAYSHYWNGSHCPKCGTQVSKSETEWLDSLGLILERQITVRVNGTRFLVDALDANTNTVYEFNGDYWHGNPDIYSFNDVNVHNGKTFGELYRLTLSKVKALSVKYKVISMWENDWKRLKSL